MKFKFPLEKVLKHRNIQVDLAKKDFMEAQDILQRAIDMRDHLVQQKTLSLEKRSEVIQQKNNWQFEVEQINQFVAGQDLRIAQQNESLKRLEKEVESRRQILLKALTEARMIEKIKERKKQDFMDEFNATEQKEFDEIATLKHARIAK